MLLLLINFYENHIVLEPVNEIPLSIQVGSKAKVLTVTVDTQSMILIPMNIKALSYLELSALPFADYCCLHDDGTFGASGKSCSFPF